MRDLINIIEGVGDNFVYHSSPVDSINKILYQDFIKSNTSHYIPKISKKYMNYGKVDGISLTRSYEFAKWWMDGGNAILVLDYNKLKNNFKIVPFSYYIIQNDKQAIDEYEEFLVHRQGIHELNKYLVRIDIPYKIYEYCLATNNEYMEGYEPYEIITDHPLLNII